MKLKEWKLRALTKVDSKDEMKKAKQTASLMDLKKLETLRVV